MAKTTKTSVGVLDPTAMYQAGAAETTTTKDEGGGIFKQIGEFALSYYLKSVENLKVARHDENELFRSLDQAVIDSKLDLNDAVGIKVQDIKTKLTGANKILNSARWMLLPNSEEYKKAEKNRNEALLSIQNMQKNYENFPSILGDQIKMVNGQLVLNPGTEKEAMVGMSAGSTFEEVYNTSLLVSGQIQNAIEIGDDGEFYVNWEGVTDWDNPLTEKVETKKDYTDVIGEVGKTNLKDMKFAQNDNPYIPDAGGKFTDYMIAQGSTGKILLPSAIAEHTSYMTDALSKMTPKNLVNYLFKENGFIDADEPGGSTSIVNKLIYQNTDIYDTDGVEGLSEVELLGAQETIKSNILNQTFKTDGVIQLFQEKGERLYQEHKNQYDIEHPEAKSSNNARDAQRIVWKDIRKFNASYVVGKKNGHAMTIAGIDWRENLDKNNMGLGTFRGKSGGTTYTSMSLEAILETFAPLHAGKKY